MLFALIVAIFMVFDGPDDFRDCPNMTFGPD